MAGPDTSDDALLGEARRKAKEMIGRVIGDRYRILELVAMGGMGAIFRAEHLLMHKDVAIKILHPQIEGFPELVTRFEREAVAGAHIQHPNVASASDFGKFDGESCFLVLEYIEGTTLRDLIARGPIPPVRAAGIARQTAAALAAVHERGIVHRDLKPLNVMVLGGSRAGEDRIKLIDFGLAKVPIEQLSPRARDEDPIRRSLTAAGVVMGTVAYLAPESALGMRNVGPPADLYALGIVLYEMLAGRHPFDGDDPRVMFAQHRKERPPPIGARSPGVSVPPALEAVVMRLLEKDPDARFKSAGEVMAALDAALAEPARPTPVGVSELTPVAVSTGALRGRGRAVLYATLGAIAAALTATTLYLALRSAEAPPVASATPTAPAAPPPATAGPAPLPVAETARDKLRAAVDARDPRRAATVLDELIAADPAAFADRAVQTEAAEAAMLAATVDNTKVDALFERLGTKLGPQGLDVLYDLVTKDAGSADPMQRIGLTPPKSAPARAKAILARPEVLLNASPAMRVALDLLRTPCSTRPTLLPRAAKDGDDRALQILSSMVPPACTPGRACCFPKHRQLERTIADIQARIRR